MLQRKRRYYLRHIICLFMMLISLYMLLLTTVRDCIIYNIFKIHCTKAITADLLADPYRNREPMLPKLIMGDTDICMHPNLTHLIYVLSSPSNIGLRTNLRSTWADKNLFRHGKTKLVFFMGKPPSDQIQQLLSIENKAHGDIIQGDFNGTTETNPINAVFGLDFMVTHCSNVANFINSNEKTIINIFEMIRLTQHYGGLLDQYIICDTRIGLRNTEDSIALSNTEQVLPGSMCYPDHCSEAFFAIPYALLFNLHSAIGKSKFIWKHNIYVTGLLMEIVKIEESVQFIPLNNNVSASYIGLRRGYLDELLPIWPVILTGIEDSQIFKDTWLLMLDRIPKKLLREIHINWKFLA